MRKRCSLCFYSQSDGPGISAEMTLSLAMIDIKKSIGDSV